MSGLTEKPVKEFVSAEEFDCDDDLLASFQLAAEQALINYVRRDLTTEFGKDWPKPLQTAVELMVSQLYDDYRSGREGAQDRSLFSVAVRSLVDPYRDMGA